MGKTVALIEPRRHLGGMTSGGLSAVDIGDPRTVGGIAREFFTRRAGDHPALAGCARFGRPRLWLAPFSRSGLYNPEERRRQSRVHDHRPEGRVAPFR
jgi:hypothetical protein